MYYYLLDILFSSPCGQDLVHLPLKGSWNNRSSSVKDLPQKEGLERFFRLYHSSNSFLFECANNLLLVMYIRVHNRMLPFEIGD